MMILKNGILVVLMIGCYAMGIGQESSLKNNYQDMKLIYVGDPMCSWCYGISDELKAVVDHFKDKLELEVVVGGLRAGGGDVWNDEFKEFLQHHWEDVSKKSGMTFSYELFKLKDFNYDTAPSCRAVVIAKDMNEKVTLEFFQQVQSKFYMANKDPKEVEFYKSICKGLGLDFEVFKNKFDSAEYIRKTNEHFLYAQKIGVRSFPTILLFKNETLLPIAQGYAKSEVMINRIEELVNRSN